MSECGLRGWTIDWDGSPMKDGEPPLDGLSCKDLRDACDEIESFRSQLATAQATYLQFCKKHDEKMEKAREALQATLCELTACANQLSVRGLPGHPEDSVSRAQKAARAVLKDIT